MPVSTLVELPGVTQQVYEAIGARLGAGEAPTGILYHACGPVPGGWRIMDIWNSREAFDSFLDSAFLPALREIGGSEPSRREAVETYHAGLVRRE